MSWQEDEVKNSTYYGDTDGNHNEKRLSVRGQIIIPIYWKYAKTKKKIRGKIVITGF